VKSKVKIDGTGNYYEIIMQNYTYLMPLAGGIVRAGDVIEETPEYILVEVIYEDGVKDEVTFDKIYIEEEFLSMNMNKNPLLLLAEFEFYVKTSEHGRIWLDVLDHMNPKNRASLSIETLEIGTAFIEDRKRFDKLKNVVNKNAKIIQREVDTWAKEWTQANA